MHTGTNEFIGMICVYLHESTTTEIECVMDICTLCTTFFRMIHALHVVVIESFV